MTRDEIDILWQQAMKQAIADGEMFTRHHFAKLVAAAEREACAQVAEWEPCITHTPQRIAAAIRARGNA